ncbi:MAG: glutathionylspermidine synthase family protein [Deltaproteobacteria bacterium]|nr:glutathionylspermidine synthase family protein [Deltaproteobacteria bacterium]
MTYEEFAAELMRTRVLSDPWLDGAERFRLSGLVLPAERVAALATAAEAVGALLEEIAEVVWREPALLDDYYHLTPYQKLMWLSARGAWHGIARADLFETEGGGIACCEVNSDTPSGQAEAVLLNRLLLGEHGPVEDPNTGFRDRFLDMLRTAHGARPIRRVGIVYPTELTEDLSMIALYRDWLGAAGIDVVLGSPFNLGWGLGGNLAARGGQLTLLGEPVDLVLRHYKTDWWGERLPVWFDQEPYPEPEALHQPLTCLLQASERGDVTVVNPFGAVITQNKLSYALCHEEKHRFSPRARDAIDRYLPETRRFVTLDRARLAAERTAWVLKSDYGCEGAETLVGAFTAEKEWLDALEMAIPSRWVAQRFFRVAPDGDGTLPNIGVFLVGGTAAAYFTRLAKGPTSYGAQTAPTYVRPQFEA